MRFLKDELSVSVRLQEKSIEALPFRTKIEIEIESDNQKIGTTQYFHNKS